MSEAWKAFWSSYRYAGTIREDLLYEQVGRTVNGLPVPQAELDLAVQFIRERLALTSDDVLFEFCCGNGLVSYELATGVRQVMAVDFSDHLIESARRFRQRPNIVYMVGDALQDPRRWLQGEAPRKFLMANALAYFEPAEFDRILGHVVEVAPPGDIRFLLTAIPDADRKWKFYDTPERREQHEEQLRRGDNANGGMGRWWTQTEIHEVAQRHGLSASIVPEPGAMGHYRMAALVY